MTQPTRALTALALALLSLATSCGNGPFRVANETDEPLVIVVMAGSGEVYERTVTSGAGRLVGPGDDGCRGDRMEARTDDGTVIATHPDGPCTPNEWIIHGPDDTELLPYPR